jgi:hypothetical protein
VGLSRRCARINGRESRELPVFASVESARFREEFGPLAQLLPVLPLGDNSPLAGLALEARKSPPTPPSRRVQVRNLRGELKAFTAEAFWKVRK